MSTPAQKAWYRKNRERVIAQQRRYQSENQDIVKAAHKRRYSNPEYRAKMLDRNAAWLKAHPGYSLKRTKEWQTRNREMVRAKHRVWSKSPAGKAWYQARDHARRAAKLAVTINPDSILLFISVTRLKPSVICYYCQKSTPGRTCHFDHIIPLSKGGAHSIENLCVSCPKCNQTKLNKPIQEWVRLGQQILAL